MGKSENFNELSIVELLRMILEGELNTIEKSCFVAIKDENEIFLYFKKYKTGVGFENILFAKMSILTKHFKEVLEYEGYNTCEKLGVKLYASLWRILHKIQSQLIDNK